VVSSVNDSQHVDVAPKILPPMVPCPESCDNGSGCQLHGGIIGGVGINLVQPFFTDNLSYQSTLMTNTGAVGSRVDVSHHVDVAPELWRGTSTTTDWAGVSVGGTSGKDRASRWICPRRRRVVRSRFFRPTS
jgi:hypothetical protein